MQPLPLPRLPLREADTHKGSFGSVLVVAGSERYPGAALLAALGAGRAGAGLVHLAVPAGVAPLVLPAVPFCVLHRQAQTACGGLASAAADGLLELAAGCDAVVLGPGLGSDEDTGALVLALLADTDRPLLLDADGLNHLARAGVDRLAGRPAPTVLTPHPGELARLDGGVAPHGPERARRAVALALRTGAVVVLKGHHTVVTDGRRLYTETAGNPGMATGGMGDVLAGFGGALLAALPGDGAGAAALAVHLHALAGDLAAEDLGQESVLPVDVAERFGRALALSRSRG